MAWTTKLIESWGESKKDSKGEVDGSKWRRGGEIEEKKYADSPLPLTFSFPLHLYREATDQFQTFLNTFS